MKQAEYFHLHKSHYPAWISGSGSARIARIGMLFTRPSEFLYAHALC